MQATVPSFGVIKTLIANFDIVVLFCMTMADVRVFQGSAFASFTLFELFIWTYAAPVVVGCLLIERRRLPEPCAAFLRPISLYLLWLFAVSGFWVAYQGDLGVLQDAKNVLPVAILVTFLFVRVRSLQPIVMLCNLYVIYALLACLVGLLQHRYHVPYVRPLIAGTEYKTDVEGEEIVSPVVGFSGHPNEFAMAILPAFCFAVTKLVAELRDGWRIRLFTVLATLLLTVGMVQSQARGALAFSLAAVAFIASPLGRTRGFFLKLAWISALILAIVLYGLHQAAIGAAGGSETIEVRYWLWRTALNALATDSHVLLFGDGMNYVLEWSQPIAGWQFPDAHNAWLDQALFFGLPALPLYLAIWARFFRVVEYASQQSAASQVLMDGLRAAVLALMGDYFFEPVAHAVFPLSQLFLLMGLAVCGSSLPQTLTLHSLAATKPDLGVLQALKPTGAGR